MTPAETARRELVVGSWKRDETDRSSGLGRVEGGCHVHSDLKYKILHTLQDSLGSIQEDREGRKYGIPVCLLGCSPCVCCSKWTRTENGSIFIT